MCYEILLEISLGGASYEQKGWDRGRQVVSSPRVANISDLPRQQTAVLLPHREVQLAICYLGVGGRSWIVCPKFHYSNLHSVCVCVCLCMLDWGGEGVWMWV